MIGQQLARYDACHCREFGVKGYLAQLSISESGLADLDSQVRQGIEDLRAVYTGDVPKLEFSRERLSQKEFFAREAARK